LGLTIRVIGQAARRGVIPRLPAPERLLADAQASIAAELGLAIRSMRCRPTPTGGTELLLDLHPAAPPVSIIADGTGRVTASADTSSAGPGYHTFVARLLERTGAELGISWLEDVDGTGADAQAAHPRRDGRPLAERAGVERAHLALLSRTLVRAQDLRRQGASGLHLGTPPGTRFASDGVLITPLGPRDDAWLEQATGDVRVASDIRPWWTDATDARYLLNRALCLLWTEIRWRPPADDQERAVFDEALHLLRRAVPMDPSLLYPWREWHELIILRGIDDPVESRVRPRAERVDPSRPLVGYRRQSVTVVQEGWRLEVPGAFQERRTEEEWWGGDRGRSVTLAGVTTEQADGPMRPEAFLARVAGELGDGVLSHRDGNLEGKARIATDASSGVEVAVLEGYSAVPGRGAAIRIVFQDATDWRWAVDLWRSLRPA
jgi:hypothetical protein